MLSCVRCPVCVTPRAHTPHGGRTHCGSVASFSGRPFGLAIALHACGQASDEAMMQAVNQRVPYLVAPCCVGKLKFAGGTSDELAEGQQTTTTQRISANGSRPPVVADTRALSFVGAHATTATRSTGEAGGGGGGEGIGFINRLQLRTEGTWTRLRYPRSQWLTAQLGVAREPAVAVPSTASPAAVHSEASTHSQRAQQVFADIAASADFSEMHGGEAEANTTPAAAEAAAAVGGAAVVAAPSGLSLGAKNVSAADAAFFHSCAIVVGMDRNEWATEQAGYEARLRTMPGLSGSGKADLLLGWLPARPCLAAPTADQ